MTILYGNAKLVENLRIDVDDGRSHALCLDLADNRGTDMGPSALELALMSFAGCYATIFALTARKMRIRLNALDVKAIGTKSEDTRTIAEVRFIVEVKADASEDRIRRIHELTSRDCPVGRIFDKAGVKSSYSLSIVRK